MTHPHVCLACRTVKQARLSAETPPCQACGGPMELAPFAPPPPVDLAAWERMGYAILAQRCGELVRMAERAAIAVAKIGLSVEDCRGFVLGHLKPSRPGPS